MDDRTYVPIDEKIPEIQEREIILTDAFKYDVYVCVHAWCMRFMSAIFLFDCFITAACVFQFLLSSCMHTLVIRSLNILAEQGRPGQDATFL